jgi:hypothetical protein
VSRNATVETNGGALRQLWSHAASQMDAELEWLIEHR